MTSLTPLLKRVYGALQKGRQFSVHEQVRRVWESAVALTVARHRLRDCNSVGARARVVGHLLIENRGTITIGDDVTLNGEIAPVHLAADAGGVIALGHSNSVNYGVVITARISVRLGDRVRVGPNSIITDSDVPLPGMDSERAASLANMAPVEIGDDVWLGARVTVLAGGHIGAGSVIGAGSIVLHAIPAGVLAAGNPARVIRPIPSMPRD